MNQLKEYLRFVSVPLTLLVLVTTYAIAYQLLNLPSFDQIIETAQKYYLKYGYGLVFFAAFVEGTLFVNWYFPGSTVVALGIIFTRQNSSSIILTMILIILGFFLAAIFDYLMGRYGWYHLFMKIGLRKPLEEVRKRVEKHGLPILFVAYIHPNSGALAAVSAGILRFPFPMFLLYSIAALALWDITWGTVAYFAGAFVIRYLGTGLAIASLSIWLVILTIRFFRSQKPLPNIP